MLLEEFSDILDSLLSCELFQDYCPNGIQVEGKNEIQKVATAVSANAQTIQTAVQKGVDALVVHHGMFWNRDPYPVVGAKKRKLQMLLDNQISLLAYHLPLDAHQEVGNNWTAANDLGWRDLKPFGLIGGMQIGVKGIFPKQPIETLIANLQTYYGHHVVSATGGGAMVGSAALISGGAYRELASAAREGVDCFITGNFDEPAWGIAYEEEIHFLACGHCATEKVGPKALGRYIRNKLHLTCSFIDIENPF